MTKISTSRSNPTPSSNLWSLNQQLNNLFGLPFIGTVGRTEDLEFAGHGPAIDIYENSNGFYITVDVPGFSSESFQIRYENRTLTLSGERQEEETANLRYHRKESFSGRFQRSFSLPLDIDADKITAELKDGVLTIFLPKHEAQKPREISVKAN